MDKEIIKHLRNQTVRKGKQKSWLFKLSDEQLWKIFEMSKEGQSNMAIARHLKKLGVRSKSSTRSVSQTIGKFKKRLGDISLFMTPQKIKEMGGLEGLKITQKTLTESIQHKGSGNVNLAKESKVLLEITSEIGRLEKRLQEQYDPKNFDKIAYEIMQNLDEKNTKQWVLANLLQAERRLNVTYCVDIFYTPPKQDLYKRANTIISNCLEKMMNRMKNEPERFEIIKIDKDGNPRELTKEEYAKKKSDMKKIKNDIKIEKVMYPRFES